MPDRSLPQNEQELREWLTAAWDDGYRARAKHQATPLGTRIADKPKQLERFLRSWDFEPTPEPDGANYEGLTDVETN